jgi:hypothetical protein
MSTVPRAPIPGPRIPYVLGLFLALAFSSMPAAAADRGVLGSDPIGVPLRMRDYTFPSFLVLGFAPMPSAPLGKGNYAFELHGSIINDYQVSPEVEAYLAETRGENAPRPLDGSDVEAILALPEGQAFFIDGEFDFADFAFFYGITPNLDLGLAVSAISYTGGRLDDTIFDFHNELGYGQQGRNYVPDDGFQIVFGADGHDPIVVLDGAGQRGFSDPSLHLRYAFPARSNGWQYGISAGIKAPLASTEKFLSSGGWDFGLQLVADRRFERNALIVNLSVVKPGNFEQTEIELPLLPALHVSWIHLFKRMPRTRLMLQALVAEHPFRKVVDSDLSELETQLTLALKWNTPLGVIGLGLTENVFNMDNTPDIGLHFSWGLLVQRKNGATSEP